MWGSGLPLRPLLILSLQCWPWLPAGLQLWKRRAGALLNPTQPVLGGEILIKSQISFFFFFPTSLEMKSFPEPAPGIPPVTLQNRSSPDVAGISAVKARAILL